MALGSSSVLSVAGWTQAVIRFHTPYVCVGPTLEADLSGPETSSCRQLGTAVYIIPCKVA
jgi:hypothetical protein